MNNNTINNMDELLKRALTPTDMPHEKLNNQVLWKVKERESMSSRKRIPAAIIATGVLLLSSVTAMAAYHYLSPAQVAEELDDNALNKAFLGDEAVLVNETQEIGDYRVTLLGSAAGKNISDYLFIENGMPKGNRIYTVVAIEHTDGTPMPDTGSDEYGNESFYVSHYIHGLDPKQYSLMTMGGGYSEVVRDGIQYRILEMDNIEMFADRGIYVGVTAGVFYDSGAYIYDEISGDISRNPDYIGLNALFELPIDKNKADPEAAERYLHILQYSWDRLSEPIERNETQLAVDEFMKKITPENLDEYAAPVESTRMVCPVDDEGVISYEYEFEDGASGSGADYFDSLFPDSIVGTRTIRGYSYSDGGLKKLNINVFILNEDGTVTFVIYQPIL